MAKKAAVSYMTSLERILGGVFFAVYLLVLPFAYEDGGRWTAVRNGVKVPVEQVFEGMMGVKLEEGENAIQLRYHHPGAAAGAAVSAVSAAAAIVWFAAEKRRGKGGKDA